MKFALDHPVHCTDGTELVLGDVVVDPRALVVTHVAVQPRHNHDDARLVPVHDLRTEGDGLVLDCTDGQLLRYPLVAEVSVVNAGEPLETEEGWTVGTTDIVPVPSPEPLMHTPGVDDRVTIRWDRIPADEVEVRSSTPVRSTGDQRLGSLDGLVCDASGAITHLVVKRGSVLGRRDVVIPAHYVIRVGNDQILLDLAKDDLADFDTHRVGQWVAAGDPGPLPSDG
jgi:sporulation protein YlmC with PRC-barrel domain